VGVARTLLEDEAGWSPQPIPDVRPGLARLKVEGASLSAGVLLALSHLLRSSRLTADSLRSERVSALARALLAPELDRLLVSRADEKKIGAAIDDDGNVRDEASPLLRRIRRELRGSQGELVKLLERLVARLDLHHQVPDMSVTVRNGRYVIPVRREARAVVGGIVHDTSSTGGTLFVEPPAAVEAGNRIRELEADEIREIDRILAELSDALRPSRDAIAATLDALVELDTLYARARFAIEFHCGTIEFGSASDGFTVFNGRHPLLLAQGIPVVPFDLMLEPHERTLLISGPNTGGKTVLLKSVGLFAAMAQSGIPVPVGKGSRLAIFDEVFADVGDEQSISSSLSTFSAHLRNLAEVLRCATSSSLVLIDELGSGTDPVEGAALGGAILESLTRRRSLSVATTHLGALKELAAEVPGVINASLQFDAVALAPTYHLIKGIPGRSYGLSIARRLQLPDSPMPRVACRRASATSTRCSPSSKRGSSVCRRPSARLRQLGRMCAHAGDEWRSGSAWRKSGSGIRNVMRGGKRVASFSMRATRWSEPYASSVMPRRKRATRRHARRGAASSSSRQTRQMQYRRSTGSPTRKTRAENVSITSRRCREARRLKATLFPCRRWADARRG